jgi:hypothetical protein
MLAHSLAASPSVPAPGPLMQISIHFCSLLFVDYADSPGLVFHCLRLVVAFATDSCDQAILRPSPLTSLALRWLEATIVQEEK